jgi:hypothetical protein
MDGHSFSSRGDSESLKGHAPTSASGFAAFRWVLRNRYRLCLVSFLKVTALACYVAWSIWTSPEALHAGFNTHVTCDASMPEAMLPSVFCFAFAMPNSAEIPLLHKHLQHKLLSGCDGFAIYSNVTPAVLMSSDTHLPGAAVLSGSVTSSKEDSARTMYHTSANTPQLLATWQHVLTASNALDYDWTVKIDADTLLIPERLRCLLSYYTQHPEYVDDAVFLAKPDKNSVGGGTVVGQLETLNNEAMHAFKRGFFECRLLQQGQHLASLADIMFEGTEDGWFETCMYVLGVRKVVEPNLMGDVRRNKGVRHEDCFSPIWRAAYYPIKDPDEFEECVTKYKTNKANGFVYLTATKSTAPDTGHARAPSKFSRKNFKNGIQRTHSAGGDGAALDHAVGDVPGATGYATSFRREGGLLHGSFGGTQSLRAGKRTKTKTRK